MKRQHNKTYGPKLTPALEAQLREEIAAFDKKAEKETLERIEREAVGGKNIDAWKQWRQQQGKDDHGAKGSNEPVEANPDILSEDDAVKFETPTFSKQIVLATLEIKELLSFRESQVWQMVMRNGLSIKEAADKLRIGERTVEEYLSRAKAKVIEHFKDCNSDENI